MSYLVLARKWRPQNFDEVVGQPHVAKTLANAIASGRIAHAYLFTGARGVGKTSVARILARALNCGEGLSSRPCGECSNCREIAQGISPDVLEIDGASNRGIDNIRELRETVRYRPSKSRYKIYIIDEVHMLTEPAFNALLKTLEEPPEHVLFIFATTEPHKIPSTILSRCQRFDFRRIPMQLLVQHLQKIAAAENLQVSEAVLFAVAREADGSMRDAQSLLEQLLAFSGDGLEDEEVLDLLGVVDRRSVLLAAEAVLEGDVKGCLATVDAIHRRGIDMRRFCQQLCDHFRNLLFLALGEGRGRLDVSSEEAQRLMEQVEKVSAESLFIQFQILLKGEEDLRRSSLPKIALEMLLLRLAKAPRLESLQSLMGKLDTLEGLVRNVGFSSGTSPPADLTPLGEGTNRSPQELPQPLQVPDIPRTSPILSPPAVDPVGAGAVESQASLSKEWDSDESEFPGPERSGAGQTAPEELPRRWPDFVRWLQNRDPVMGAKLEKSVVALEGESATIQVLEIFEEGLKSAGALAKLQEATTEYFKIPVRWSVSSKAAEPREPAGSRERSSSRSGSKRMVLQHPVVLQALEILGGELVEIKQPRSGRRDAGKEGGAGDWESPEQ